jgi:hypothetical protein
LLAAFVHGVDKDLNTKEEMAALVPLKNTTKASDVYDGVTATLVTSWFEPFKPYIRDKRRCARYSAHHELIPARNASLAVNASFRERK